MAEVVAGFLGDLFVGPANLCLTYPPAASRVRHGVPDLRVPPSSNVIGRIESLELDSDVGRGESRLGAGPHGVSGVSLRLPGRDGVVHLLR
jgi:hypothetical protein